MDNENKRFKQINRVATPIKVSENNSINNTNVNLPNNDNNNNILPHLLRRLKQENYISPGVQGQLGLHEILFQNLNW